MQTQHFMSEHTRGTENRGNENVEQSRSQYLHRRTNGGFPEGFEGMNFEQDRDMHRREGHNERRNDQHSDDPTYRRNTDF